MQDLHLLLLEVIEMVKYLTLLNLLLIILKHHLKIKNKFMSRLKLYLLFTFFICQISLFAQELETFMQNGNDFYQNKQYDEAINSYEAILKSRIFKQRIIL